MKQELAAFYEDGYGERRGHGVDELLSGAKRRTFLRYLSLLGEPNGGSLLEIGCSAGDGLLVARELGWRVAGVELSNDAVVRGNDRLGSSTILHSSLYDLPDDFGFFDSIVLFDVIEHVIDPTEALRIVRRHLKPLGRLLLVTPDIGSLSARVLGQFWPHFLPEHLTLFSRSALRSILLNAGFRGCDVGAARRHLSPTLVKRYLDVYSERPLAKVACSLLAQIPDIVVPAFTGECYAVATNKRDD